MSKKTHGYETDFLYATGEPSRVTLDQTGKARSVWSAIHAFQAERPDEWIAMARDVFELRGPRDAALLQAEGVMAKIEETACFETSTQKTVPTRVFIDSKKRFAVEVWR